MFHKRIRAWHKENKTMYKVAELDFIDEMVMLDNFINADKKDSLYTAFENVVIMQEAGLQDDYESKTEVYVRHNEPVKLDKAKKDFTIKHEINLLNLGKIDSEIQEFKSSHRAWFPTRPIQA